MAAFHPFADLSVAYQAFGFIHSREKILKITIPKLNPISELRSPQIASPYFAPPCEGAFARSVNRTKTFHVKHFCPIEGQNRTKLMAERSAIRLRSTCRSSSWHGDSQTVRINLRPRTPVRKRI